MRPARVFVSYTHDTENHRRRVTDLASRLRADGIDARMDRFVVGTPRGGWPAWMEAEIEEADVVLLVCTASYNERYRNLGDESTGLGGRWESSLIRNLLYASPASDLIRFVPILTRTSTNADIPLPLRHSATHYRLADYQAILGHIAGVPLRPDARSSDAEGHTRLDSEFSNDIRTAYASLDTIIKSLTTEQLSVIHTLHGQPRALISGSPGSGKTLVAAEKATRLANAGLSTLFLCHNPLLADWVRRLTATSAVEVCTIEDLISDAAGVPPGDVDWTSYSQPTNSQIALALEHMRERPPRYQAVIVDEGQDFAAEWWPVVEACVPADDTATFYVFFDERQSLLPFRAELPALGWPLTLSRNCRNAGNVYEVMRTLSPTVPLPEEALLGLGHVRFFHSARLQDATVAALRWLHELGALEGVATVLGGEAGFDQSVLSKGAFVYGDPTAWQASVLREFRGAVSVLQPLMVDRDGGADARQRSRAHVDDVLRRLDSLSNDPLPSKRDVAVVREVARRLVALLPARFRRIGADRLRWSWHDAGQPGNRYKTGRLAGRSPRGTVHDKLAVLGTLQARDWAAEIPSGESVTFATHRRARARPDELPVWTVGEMKGLEREALLLVMHGDAPEFQSELFVGVSRARAVLAIVGDDRTVAALPARLRAELAGSSPG